MPRKTFSENVCFRGWAARSDQPARLDQASLQGEPGEICPPPTACLVSDAVKVRADRADADMQLTGDLHVGPALADQSYQLLQHLSWTDSHWDR